MNRLLSAFSAATVLCGALLSSAATADDRSYGDGRDGGWRNDARIGCESSNGRYKLCQVAIRGNVRLVREHSRADCIEGRSWGWSEAGIWVDRGCRGEFTYTPRTAGGYGGGRGELRCESNRGRTVFCPAPVQGNVVLTKQLSHAPCRYGDTWTFDRRGISVRDGCRAEFRFDARRR